MNKPVYKVPTMAEIAATAPAFNVVSTFSGCGGSSTGYRMAGGRVLWASEFVEAARDTYRANAAPYTILDPRDIRTVNADDILAATGLAPGELDLFDGSPPCASFSMAGKRAQGWGKVKQYSDRQQRSDDLFYEYARLLRGLRPKTFVAENVADLAPGVVDIRSHDLRDGLPELTPSLTLAVLTLQFVPVECRQRIVADVYRMTRPGGAFIVVEKVLGTDAASDRLMVETYYSMKRANGYTPEQIDAKRRSLQGVLVPLTAEGNVAILRAEGFRVQQFWQALNFAGWLAVKPGGV